MSTKKWVVSNNNYIQKDIAGLEDKLPKGIYKVVYDERTGFYLDHMQEEFTFPYKIYNKDEDFVKRVVTTYNNTTSNLGILLNGTKGTGKTVTAELIANALNLPVIIVTNAAEGITEYISELDQDIVIFFDEYEKIFNNENSRLSDSANADNHVLSIMDGVLNGTSRKVFLLTTNNMFINDNLLQRPSRVRYIRQYKHLDDKTIMEVVDDKLEKVEFRDEVIEFITTLKLVTIDIIKSIIEEVNIHNESPRNFKHIFNVQIINPKRDIYRITTFPGHSIETEEIVYKSLYPNITKFTEDCIGCNLTAGTREDGGGNRFFIGKIVQVIDDNNIIINEYDRENDPEEDWDVYKNNMVHYKFEEVSSYNGTFSTKKIVANSVTY